MKIIQRLFGILKRKRTGEEIIVDIIGGRISTPDDGFMLARYLAPSHPINGRPSARTSVEAPECLANIGDRCSNYLHAYQRDKLFYGGATAKRNSDKDLIREARKIIKSLDNPHFSDASEFGLYVRGDIRLRPNGRVLQVQRY